ncbi:MAG: c-type cytochrome [Archangiaceae bacterium]|nr:c-type cytochrome [Archangiaceae bacterium]
MSGLRLVVFVCIMLWSCTVEVGRVQSRSSGSAALSRDEQRVYAVDADNGTLRVFDRQSLAEVATVKVGVQPSRVTVGPDDTLYVSNRGSHSVSVVHHDTWEVAATLETGVEPMGSVVSADGKTLYVVSSTSRTAPDYGTLTAYDLETRLPLWELPVGQEPRDVALVDDHRALLTLFREGKTVLVDLTTRSVVGGSDLVDSSFFNATTAHARGLSTLAVTDLGVYAFGQAAQLEQVETLDAGENRVGYSAGIVHDSIFCADPETPESLFAMPQLQPSALSGSSAAVVMPDSTRAKEQTAVTVNRQASRLTLVPLASAALALQPRGGWVNQVTIDPGTDGLAVTSDLGNLFTYSQFTHRLTRVGFQFRFDLPSWSIDGQSDPAPEVVDAEVALGRALFDDANNFSLSRNALACSSCHLEGREDGHTWRLPQGIRQTPSLAGRRLAETAPYHWQGELPTLPAFYDHTVKTLMGGNGLDERQTQALSRYLESLPLPENPRRGAPMTAQEKVGQATFVKAGCDACHRGAALADVSEADVGTGGSYNVPSLLGLGRSAPYLHDGTAPTLEARFQTASGDRHGNVSQLTADELSSLIAYLKTL